jgi:hypothetical protein
MRLKLLEHVGRKNRKQLVFGVIHVTLPLFQAGARSRLSGTGGQFMASDAHYVSLRLSFSQRHICSRCIAKLEMRRGTYRRSRWQKGSIAQKEIWTRGLCRRIGRAPLRDLPDVKLFPGDLIDDMHKTFEAVCARLRLAPQSDKVTALVVTKIVELAKAGRKGDDLTAETLRFFEAYKSESRGGQSVTAARL